MSKNNTMLTLAAMEAIAGGMSIQRRAPIQTKVINYPPIGMSNKKCPGCGHKNKKCTCPRPGE
jgi:hypothetical protein